MFPKTRSYPKEFIVKDNVWKCKFTRKSPDNWEDTLGLCDPSTKEIFVKMGQKRRQIFETFCHELFHVIEDEYNIKIGHKLINKMEVAFADIYEDNYDLIIDLLLGTNIADW
jgi:hypothetical protein